MSDLPSDNPFQQFFDEMDEAEAEIYFGENGVVEQWLQEYHPELASRSNVEDPFRQPMEGQQEVSNLLDTLGNTPFVVTELESAQQLQADQLYLSVPSGSLLVPERGPYTQLQEHLNNQGLPQYIPFGNPPSQITSYTGSDALFPLWSPNDTPGRSTQTASPQSLPPTFTHSIQLETAAGPASAAHNSNENLIPSSSLDFGLNSPIAFPPLDLNDEQYRANLDKALLLLGTIPNNDPFGESGAMPSLPTQAIFGAEQRLVEPSPLLSSNRLKRKRQVKERGQKEYICPICGGKFSRNFNLIRHIPTHYPEAMREKFPCTEPGCKSKLSSLVELNKHKRNVHGVGPPPIPRKTKAKAQGETFPCERAPACKKRYRDHNAYVDHLKNEHGLYRERIVVTRTMEPNPAYPRGPHEPHDPEPGPSNWQSR
ncbi:hypothetical protein PCANC_00415 [Puccinia coronata f. sp. avenae]|uniref:C2H2-type domain-containing protein n=1 Tax=Puccinia coronata f. sp. avenae TaxID=200324 RepID=A0A2N5W9G1_9BASI|nr:hypothetical protein PCANC_11938 [Puccinia coronata f. sp. avenae]PLW24430.1 hypothetical protein PCASD_11571 [Puccinia coronata f. sp. avenae]PLW52140.1 hypothetical protein PCASD_02055 [Puccinia coronata f. sp. avenae]PLW58883.1 hypothetical protein PCANC_00415 [Puccinia coronata f. sp. avenae]